MVRSVTYRMFVQATALLLLIGVALPTGLHAKALVDFCMAPVAESTGMLPGHSCCPSDSEDASNHDLPETMHHPESQESPASHNHCESAVICTCHFGQSLLKNQNWTTQQQQLDGLLAEITTITPELHADRHAVSVAIPDLYSTPPIFLLNSAFLN
ncbi:MAG: hypothetical protein WD355_12300 [Balneolaceae bacterium]